MTQTMVAISCLSLWSGRGDLRPECIRVSLKDLSNSLLSYGLIFYVVAAPIAIAVLAIFTT